RRRGISSKAHKSSSTLGSLPRSRHRIPAPPCSRRRESPARTGAVPHHWRRDGARLRHCRCRISLMSRCRLGDMDIRLDGKSAVITGGSKGLGLAMAEKFASSGADVAILARSPDTLAEAKEKILASAKGKVAAVSTDVSKAADIRRAFDVMSDLGKIDILVN